MGLPLGTDTLRAGGGVIAFARHPCFSSQSRSKTPAPIRVDFYIGSTSPYAQYVLFCLGAGSGIPPAAAPSFRGVLRLIGVYEVRRSFGRNDTAVVDPRSCELRWRTDKGQTVPGRIRIRATWDYQAGRGCSRCGITPRRGRRETRRPTHSAGGMDRIRTCGHGFAGRCSASELPPHMPGIRRAGKEERKKTTPRQGQAGWWDRPESNRRHLLFLCSASSTELLSHVAGLSRRSLAVALRFCSG